MQHQSDRLQEIRIREGFVRNRHLKAQFETADGEDKGRCLDDCIFKGGSGCGQ